METRVTRIVTVTQAKAHLAELIDQSVAGDEIIITRQGEPVVTLVRVAEPRRRMGVLAGDLVVPDEFFDPLPEDELAVWEQ